jgi:hypothetical protein
MRATTQDCIKEYISASNRYIQWMVYDELVDKQSADFSSNLINGLFVISKVFIFLAIQDKEIDDLRDKTDRASMYYIEFYREFGIYPGLFEFTNVDTALFILDKTVLNELGYMSQTEENTSELFDILTALSTLYMYRLRRICDTQPIDCSSDCSIDCPGDDAGDELDLVVSHVVNSVNKNILPCMRDIISYRTLHDHDETILYIEQLMNC